MGLSGLRAEMGSSQFELVELVEKDCLFGFLLIAFEKLPDYSE